MILSYRRFMMLLGLLFDTMGSIVFHIRTCDLFISKSLTNFHTLLHFAQVKPMAK